MLRNATANQPQAPPSFSSLAGWSCDNPELNWVVKIVLDGMGGRAS